MKAANVIILATHAFLALVYLDYALWYSTEMHNLYSDNKRKFRGVLCRFWDWIDRKLEERMMK